VGRKVRSGFERAVGGGVRRKGDRVAQKEPEGIGAKK